MLVLILFKCITFRYFFFHPTNKNEEFLLNYEVDVVDIKYYINVNNNLCSLIEAKGHMIKEVNKFIKRRHIT